MKTPRTDEEYAKTLNSDYQYEGAEFEAWNWARKLERELAELTAQQGAHIMKKEQNELNSPSGSLVVWIPFRDSDGTLDVTEATALETLADDMLLDGWRWIKFNEAQ